MTGLIIMELMVLVGLKIYTKIEEYQINKWWENRPQPMGIAEELRRYYLPQIWRAINYRIFNYN